MPHSSSGYGEVKIDRIYLLEEELAKEANDMTLVIEGQESSPPASAALVSYLHAQVAAMESGRLVPVTFRDKSERNGYYTVGQTSSDLTDYQNEVIVADWTVNLVRIGHHTEVDIQSRTIGAVRQNDFSLTGTRWHAPAIGHYAYQTASGTPVPMTRTTAEGAMTVYTGLPSTAYPKWGCDPANYSGGRVRITDTSLVSSENELEGANRFISANAWSMTNSLINVVPTASAGIIDAKYYNGSAWVSNLWTIKVGGSTIAAWDTASILRNDFEMCILRLTASQNPGRVQLDLTLRRGSRFVECYLQTSASSTMNVIPSATGTFVTTPAGTLIESSGTHRRIIGSAHTFTGTTAGSMTRSSTVSLDFFLGAVINAASPTAGDSGTNLRDQYIACMPEMTYAVKR